MKLRSCFATTTLAAFLLLSHSALAADPKGASAADRATARALAAEAHKAFDLKDYVTAADKFARADSLIHAPTLLLGLARSQAALGRLVAANESLNQILREGLAPNAPKVWADAIEEARKEVTFITPRMAWITVSVRGVTAGHEDEVKLVIDGVEVNAAAIGVPRAVDPGQHNVVAKVQWGKGSQGTIKLEEGKKETITLDVKLDPPPAGVVKAPPANGTGGPQYLVVTTPPPPAWRRTLGFATIGVGGALIVVGAATGGAVLSIHKSLASSCTGGRCPASQNSKLQTYNALGAVSTAGFIGGAVLGGIGVALVLTTPKEAKPAAPKVGFGLVPVDGGSALGAMGSF